MATRSAKTARSGMSGRTSRAAQAHGGGSGRRQPTAALARSGGDLTMGPNATRTKLPKKDKGSDSGGSE